eukprot:gnl/TRDRNA2_/TRDRNA2_168169_c0_seq1.p2 gnl/TRDRNA2_/TRDRNA2_168169_c0~~gnl/TRDRNA2_/TRDRNA2_168169_c0_seq1.p2  ORF type:complete len:143 (+),score=17.60 gnl/TRDRNA2_/TRDRNA2_168169_c0_seq1:2-430(+)
MQLPTQKQWWSNPRTQLSHHLQCEASLGRRIWHVLQSFKCENSGDFINSDQNSNDSRTASSSAVSYGSASKRDIMRDASSLSPALRGEVLPGGLRKLQYISSKRRDVGRPSVEAVAQESIPKRGKKPGSLDIVRAKDAHEMM